MMTEAENSPKFIRVPWHTLSAIRAGMGEVALFAPENKDELIRGISYFLARKMTLVPSGGGTNFIGADSTDDSLCVVSLRKMLASLRNDGAVWQVPAGMTLARFIVEAAGCGWGGMAPLSGIPGTVGGALAMNAGANSCDIAGFVQAVSGINLESGTLWTWNRSENNAGDWGYRRSPVPGGILVLNASLGLQKIDAETENKAICQERFRRARVTPRGFSCGSVFRNPPDAPPAGVLLEQAGCKGLSKGPFSVSLQHANWIVNLSGTPGACTDCQALVDLMQKRVLDRFGISIIPEWRFL